MAALSRTLHLATLGYFVPQAASRSNILALASIYRLEFVPLVPLPPVAPPRRIDHDSPGVFRLAERDFSER